MSFQMKQNEVIGDSSVYYFFTKSENVFLENLHVSYNETLYTTTQHSP